MSVIIATPLEKGTGYPALPSGEKISSAHFQKRESGTFEVIWLDDRIVEVFDFYHVGMDSYVDGVPVERPYTWEFRTVSQGKKGLYDLYRSFDEAVVTEVARRQALKKPTKQFLKYAPLIPLDTYNEPELLETALEDGWAAIFAMMRI
ncbi:hypothetical protein ACYPKM_02430 [Pseudomonas aeruginosa]